MLPALFTKAHLLDGRLRFSLCSQCKRSTTARSARGTFRAAQQTQHPLLKIIGLGWPRGKNLSDNGSPDT